MSKDETGRSKGFAHITFEYRKDATTAVNEASGAMLEGRAMRTGFANQRQGQRRNTQNEDDY